GERGLEVALQLVHRAEVVPDVDAEREAAAGRAGERPREEPDRLVVLVAAARGVGGAAGARRGPGRPAGRPAGAARLPERAPLAPVGAELEPARDPEVVAALHVRGHAGEDDVAEERVGEAELARARDRRRLRDRPGAIAEAGEGERDADAGAVAG